VNVKLKRSTLVPDGKRFAHLNVVVTPLASIPYNPEKTHLGSFAH
jgi:hypothetical protein